MIGTFENCPVQFSFQSRAQHSRLLRDQVVQCQLVLDFLKNGDSTTSLFQWRVFSDIESEFLVF